MTATSRLLVLLGSTVLTLAGGCDRPVAAEAVPTSHVRSEPAAASGPTANSTTNPATNPVTNPGAPPSETPDIEPYRLELLDLAFDTASAIPLKPHVKDRSRAQEAVVDACLELDLPRQALAYSEGIANWRHGLALARYASYCAEHGDRTGVLENLKQAENISYGLEDWRRDRIRITIGGALLWLGYADNATFYEDDVVESEQGKVDWVRVRTMDDDQFDRILEDLSGVFATGGFDVVKNAMWAGVYLFDRVYPDASRRSRVEDRIRRAWSKLPHMIRLDLLMEMIGSALDHDDPTKALSLVNDGQTLLDDERWLPEYVVPMRGRLAGLRHRAGDAAGARAEIARALREFDESLPRIADIYRAGALRPLAEACHAMGDDARTRMLYGRIVDAGLENPNSRPRAEDLSATCVSLALHAVEPDKELWARLRAIREGLHDPW